MAKTKDAPRSAEEALDDVSPLLQHRSRLGALVLLSQSDALSFSRLRDSLKETDGNLGAHLRKLEEAGYVSVKKEFVERKPVSWYTLTGEGLRDLRRHLRALGEMIARVNGEG